MTCSFQPRLVRWCFLKQSAHISPRSIEKIPDYISGPGMTVKSGKNWTTKEKSLHFVLPQFFITEPVRKLISFKILFYKRINYTVEHVVRLETQMLPLPCKCHLPFLNLKKQSWFVLSSSGFMTLIGNGKEIASIHILQIDWRPYFVIKHE